MQFTKRVTDVLWDGDFQRSRVSIHIQIKKTFLTYVGNVFFLFFLLNKSNTIKVAYTKILFLIDMPNEAK